ncbi:DUF4097 family beta strand repeat-containing protein [Dictyobacter aurantiacus]|uniref:DUF4097 domain-containing protein n=1 Tax=Dictyobacter aurantiacus TaxID=1936993 RepID=A0A401ZF14_9CHLR|nr:DUF4097 family beta strand repeat-containing protein [Dictyobacter aurantiacus]GCE05429.1 hypothetical protein KDAU_27580 [Dictyobacter aurantiacus]
MRRKQLFWLAVIGVVLIMLLVLVIGIYKTDYATDTNTLVPSSGAAHDASTENSNGGPEQQSFQVSEHAQLLIKGHSSDINVRRGATSTLVIVARKHGTPNLGPAADNIHVLYHQSSDAQGHDHITIDTDPALKDLDYDVTAPASAQVQIEITSGAVVVQGIAGASIDTINGNPDVEDIQGPVKVHTESGDVTARHINGPMSLEAGSGSIHANDVNGQLQALTRSGDVLVSSGIVQGQTTLKTDNGSVRFEGSMDGKGSYNLATHSGDVDLTLPRNAAFQLNATTGSGDVHNEFGSSQVGAAPQAHITVTIGHGSVNVDKLP